MPVISIYFGLFCRNQMNPKSVRIKHDYATYLLHAKGQDDTSIDKARAAIRRIEESTKFKPFKKFHRQQAADFKDYLDKDYHAAVLR